MTWTMKFLKSLVRPLDQVVSHLSKTYSLYSKMLLHPSKRMVSICRMKGVAEILSSRDFPVTEASPHQPTPSLTTPQWVPVDKTGDI